MSYSGMATPFGIRIYTPLAQAGATDVQMYMAGAVYGLIIFICQYAVGYWQAVNETTIDASLKSLIGVALYLIVFKFTPIASIHASEHQVVHAMENGSELNHDSVKQQDRVHPRCGTNLMTLFLMFGLFIDIIKQMPVASWAQMLMGVAAFMLSSHTSTSIGGFLQKHFTTKPARPQDIDRAIEIGIEHNTRFVKYIWQNDMPSKFKMFLMNIKHSGMVYTLLAYIPVYLLLSAFFAIPGH